MKLRLRNVGAYAAIISSIEIFLLVDGARSRLSSKIIALPRIDPRPWIVPHQSVLPVTRCIRLYHKRAHVVACTAMRCVRIGPLLRSLLLL